MRTSIVPRSLITLAVVAWGFTVAYVQARMALAAAQSRQAA